jgi:hypothetical protein
MKRTLTVLGVTAALVFAMATPASAHDVRVTQGANWGRVLYDGYYHRTITVHDGECDGHYHVARVDYYTNIDSVIRSLWDGNGCSYGDNSQFYASGVNITRFRLCEGVNGGYDPTYWCTSWINT